MAALLGGAIYVLTLFNAHAFGHPTNSHGITPTAHITNGTINGRYLSNFNQDLFLGVPFANAPRLANPIPVNETWDSPFDASAYGATCYGFGSNQLLPGINTSQSEDCLNLNIIRPSGVNLKKPLPVLLWIYGGGYRQGSSADPMWNMSYIVQTSVENGQPIIGVSINYRLSFLGFPTGREVMEAGAANLGLKDQRIAFQWVQENIAAFGGDPKQVTIWGESAGASSVAFQLIAYGGEGGTGLFRAGMMASGFVTGIANPKPSNSQANQALYEAMLNATNCLNATDGLECLRTVPIDAIYKTEDSVGGWQPVIDGDFIRQEPVMELDAGNVARVPIVLGNNADEGLFVVNTVAGLFGSIPDTVDQLKVLLPQLTALDNHTIDALLEAYPPGSPMPPYSLSDSFAWCPALEAVNLTCGAEYRRAAAILGDWFVDAGRRYMSKHWTKLGLPAYSYRFSADPTSVPIQVWTGLGPGFAIHGADLAYDFRLPGGFTTFIDFYPPVKNVTGHEELSRAMVSKFVSFAYGLDPNACDSKSLRIPTWQPYAKAGTYYNFNATDAAPVLHNEADTYRSEGIGIWNNHIQAAYYE